jgi:hypothetical protein
MRAITSDYDSNCRPLIEYGLGAYPSQVSPIHLYVFIGAIILNNPDAPVLLISGRDR